ncbi:hypothetical protein ABIB40_002347 [Pedobacter sp. UYP30]|uniref:hypothetical protein n=1 Tax=Pedobacter sp. UYP30 TaxID=1756400 RepID=UPI0033987595
MKRRNFIMLTGVALGAVIVPPTLYFVSPSIKEFAIKLIEKELSYLKLRPGIAAQYVDDYFEHNKNNVLETAKWKTFYYLNYTAKNSNSLSELVKYFLLSTDFFIHKTDTVRGINYLGLYSPYTSPIPNPFSYVIYPPNSIKNI